MSPGADSQAGKPHILLRRCILQALYEFFRENPDFPVETEVIREKCDSSPKEINWNLAYLEQAGLVKLSREYGSQPYIASIVFVTVEGIDLVEDEEQLDLRFPLPEESDQD